MLVHDLFIFTSKTILSHAFNVATTRNINFNLKRSNRHFFKIKLFGPGHILDSALKLVTDFVNN